MKIVIIYHNFYNWDSRIPFVFITWMPVTYFNECWYNFRPFTIAQKYIGTIFIITALYYTTVIFFFYTSDALFLDFIL